MRTLKIWLILTSIIYLSFYSNAASLTLSIPPELTGEIAIKIPKKFPDFLLSCNSGLSYSTEQLPLNLPHLIHIDADDECELLTTKHIPSTATPKYEKGLSNNTVRAIKQASNIDLFIYQNQPIPSSTLANLISYTSDKNNAFSSLFIAKLALYYQLVGKHQLLIDKIEELVSSTNREKPLYFEAKLLKAQSLMVLEKYQEATAIAKQWHQNNLDLFSVTHSNISGFTLFGFTQLLAGENPKNDTKIALGYSALNQAYTMCQEIKRSAPSNCLPEIYNGFATYYRIKKDLSSAANMLIAAVLKTEQNILDLPSNKQWHKKALNFQLSDYTNNLAVIWRMKGDIAKSQHLLRRSLFYNIELPTASRKAISYRNLAKSYQILGNFDLAERYFLKSLSISEEQNSDFGITDTHLTLLKLELIQEKYYKAQQRLTLHIDNIVKNIPVDSNELLAIQAQIFAGIGQWERALTFYRPAFDLFEQHLKIQSPDASLNLLTAGLKIASITSSERIRTEISPANDRLLSYIENNKLNSISNALEFERLKNKILIENITSENNNFRDDIENSVNTIFVNIDAIISQLMTTLDSIDSNTTGFDWISYATKLIKDISPLFLNSSDEKTQQKLWQLTEKIDAAVLIKQRYLSLSRQELEPSLLDANLLNEKITTASLNILSNKDNNDENNKHQLDVLKDKQLAYREKNSLIVTHREALPIQEIMQEIGPNTALLKYLAIDNTYFVFWLTQDNWGFSKLGFKDSDMLRYKSKSSSHSGLLEELIPNNIRKNNSISKLLIKPGGELHNLSFAAVKNKSKEYLTDKYSITRIPSVSMYFSARVTKRPNKEFLNDISIFMDPEFTNEALAKAIEDTGKEWLTQFTPLPWTRKSESNIREIFYDNNVSILSGHFATKEALLSTDMRRSKLLHIATHAYYHPKYPDLSGLITASTNSRLGYISLDELLAKPIYSNLVVLSA